MEPVYCDECLTWIQRYYKDIPYLQMHLNQMLMQNRDLERENRDFISELQQTLPQANKRFRKSGDIIIKNSTNINVVMSSEMHDSSFSNV
jgi:hypothetical protein